jgi:hypothetical protein
VIFAIRMRKSHLLIILLSFCFNCKLQAQSLRVILTQGNWCISKPIDSLHVSDSLVIIQKPMNSFGKWVNFGKDSAWKQRQTYHCCQRNKKGAYTMSVGYKWVKRGTWSVFYENLEITLGNRKMDLMTKSISANSVKFVVATIN